MVSSGSGGEIRVSVKESLWRKSIPRDDNDNRAKLIVEERFGQDGTKHISSRWTGAPRTSSQLGMRNGDRHGEGLPDRP